ncbi:hypothetical protein [Nonomuraea roseola]|uniref:NAD-dependent epimerase/dehydratase family protein n=1 Tax=Nonomuraea roseola TaxID=46179 RepID=A0ABV5Q583_9ACTN
MTGATGGIGGPLVEALVRAGHRVVAAGRAAAGRADGVLARARDPGQRHAGDAGGAQMIGAQMVGVRGRQGGAARAGGLPAAGGGGQGGAGDDRTTKGPAVQMDGRASRVAGTGFEPATFGL